MPEFTADGMGVYSFPGGNVTYDGVSLGSTATYRASGGYLVNGVRILERRCKDTMWTDLELIVSDESELKCYHTGMYRVNYVIMLDLFIQNMGLNLEWWRTMKLQ